ncbi:MAG: TlyA family RNA methyltransferase [Spirochaetaceae bacterium]
MAKRSLLSILRSRFPDVDKDRLFARILCGEVAVDGEVERDPKRVIPSTAAVELIPARFVSRGGEKLEAAVFAWDIEVRGRVFLDAGASTGGFTDCLLRYGAAAVHAVDVGYNQLAYSLRQNPRVFVHESTNIRSVTTLDPRPDAAVCDLSFRSLRGVAGGLLELTAEGWFIALLKPQFEWRDAPAAFDGVVRDSQYLRRIILETLTGLAEEGAYAHRLLPSPLRGRRGNREYLVLCTDRTGPLPEALLASLGDDG